MWEKKDETALGMFHTAIQMMFNASVEMIRTTVRMKVMWDFGQWLQSDLNHRSLYG